MNPKFRSLLAVILALWLPLFSGNALAVTVSMTATCQENMVREASQGIDAPVHVHHGDFSCNTCGFCHIAGTVYLAAQESRPPAARRPDIVRSFYRVSFSSVTPPPLVPPPLTAL